VTKQKKQKSEFEPGINSKPIVVDLDATSPERRIRKVASDPPHVSVTVVITKQPGSLEGNAGLAR